VDCFNIRVQHWDLNGEWIATYPMKEMPQCVTSCGDARVVGGIYDGVHVFSHKSGCLTDKWWCNKNREYNVSEVLFMDATAGNCNL
jgi:hypothetical protein